MKRSIGAMSVAALVLAAACAGASTPSGSKVSSPASSPVASVAGPSASNATGAIVGSWHRAQTCQEMLIAFQRAGLAESHADWLTGNFYGGSPAPSGGSTCAGARRPLEHAHAFTAS